MKITRGRISYIPLSYHCDLSFSMLSQGVYTNTRTHTRTQEGCFLAGQRTCVSFFRKNINIRGDPKLNICYMRIFNTHFLGVKLAVTAETSSMLFASFQQEELKLHHVPTPKLTKPAICVVMCVTALIPLNPNVLPCAT